MNTLEFQELENGIDARVGDKLGVVWVPSKSVRDVLVLDSSTYTRLNEASVVSKLVLHVHGFVYALLQHIAPHKINFADYFSIKLQRSFVKAAKGLRVPLH